MIVYKLTHNGRSIILNYNNKYSVEYIIGQKTYPKIGKLYAYTMLSAIRPEYTINGDFKVFLCKARKARTRIAAFATIFDEQTIELFWSRKHCTCFKLSDVAVLCDWIEPIELITYEKYQELIKSI